MWTVVLLAAFLLAASATPIDNISGEKVEDTPSTNSEDGHAREHHGSDEGNTDTHGDQGPVPADTLTVSTNDHTDIDGEESPSPHDTLSAATDDETDGQTKEADTSPVSTVSTPSEVEESTQETNGSFTLPPDADPEDCRNASKPNHAFLLCSYSCQGDEMFTAPNRSVCFLNTSMETIGNRITQEYNHTQHDASVMGVCIDGQCISNSTDPPTAITESSSVPDASDKITGQTETSTSEQVSVSQSPQQKNSSAESVDNPENPAGPAEMEEVSSTTANSPIALPAALRAMN